MNISDLERALYEGRAPWGDSPEYRTKTFWCYKDKFPVSPGHLLFVPTQENWQCLADCFKAAYQAGYNGIDVERWNGFNVGQNVGVAAGQTVMYPHVHMIPRYNGDTEDPRGGIRHCIPGRGNYLSPS